MRDDLYPLSAGHRALAHDVTIPKEMGVADCFCVAKINGSLWEASDNGYFSGSHAT